MKWPKIKKRDIAIVLIVVPSALLLFSLWEFIVVTAILKAFSFPGIDLSFMQGEFTVAETIERLLSFRMFVMESIKWLTGLTTIALIAGSILMSKAPKKEVVLSTKSYLKKAMRTIRPHISKFVPFLLLAFVIKMMVVIPQVWFGKSWVSDIFNVIEFFTDSYVELGIIVVTLGIVYKQAPRLKDFFVGQKMYFKYLFGAAFYGIIVALGFVAFVIPGVYLAMRYLLFPYFLLRGKDGDMIASIKSAFKKSAKATQGAKMDMFLMSYALQLLIFTSMIPFGLGLFITLPLASTVWAMVYKSRL